jgi:hypothetical protein
VIKNLHVVRASAKRIEKASQRVLRSYQDGVIEHEPTFTDRLLGGIEEAMDEFEVKGVRWRSKTLTYQGPHAQESRYGADFVGVLSIDVPGYSVSKGFLAQAKRIDPNEIMASRDWTAMKSQCEKMLELSPDSFVFLYSKEGISVVPAISVVGASTWNPHDLSSRSITRFYEEHFQCFIGDRQISSPTIETLRELEARRLLYLAARGVNEATQEAH